jgi:hypothetical protein
VIIVSDAITSIETVELLLRKVALGPATLALVLPLGEPPRLDLWLVRHTEWESARELHGHPLRTADQTGAVLYAR